MVCPQCRSANPEGNRFCYQCGVALAIRGEIALRAKDWPAAHGDLVAALAIAQAIPYPALAWQVARLLAQAAAGADRMDEARAAAADARATIEHLAARAPEPALR